MRRPLALLAAAVALLAAGCGSSGGKKATAGAAAQPPAPGCRAVARPRPKGAQHLAAPRAVLPRGKRYVVTLVTNCGEIDITLAARGAPKTAASFASLVRKGFYDGLTFHRIGHDPSGADFVIQGGDPLGTGQGGPGYSVTERPPAGVHYTRGTVAMAKTELEPAGTSGSQFFIVTAEDAGLPPDYAIVGLVTRGDETVSRIAAARAGPTEAPVRPIVIASAKLTVK